MGEWDGRERRAGELVNRAEVENLSGWLEKVDGSLEKHLLEEVAMEGRLVVLETDMKDIKDKVNEIHDLLTQAKGAWRLLIWIIGAAASGWALLIWIKDHVRLS